MVPAAAAATHTIFQQCEKISELEYTNNRWELDLFNNRSWDPDVRKKQFAYLVWKEDFKNFQIREDSKKSDSNLLWNEIYQLLGFFSVFQGVLLQGVSQLSSQLSCRFYKIPLTLSVLASVATLIGAGAKLSSVQHLLESIFRDKLESKARLSRIQACETRGLNFDFFETEKNSKEAVRILKNDYDELLKSAHRTRVTLLLALAVFSVLFAWLISVIMCDRY